MSEKCGARKLDEMSRMRLAMNMNSSEIRQFLATAFNDEELTMLCFDHFRAVYQNFSTGMTKGQKVQLLLDYCIRRAVLPQLLTTLNSERPQQFTDWSSQLTSRDDSTFLSQAEDSASLASTGPSLAVSLRQAEILMDTLSYREAGHVLSEIVRENPHEPRARLLYALALLRGRNPELVSHREIEQIETHLCIARLQPQTRPVASVALVVIKHDFYAANGMDEGTPSLQQLLNDIRAQMVMPDELPLLQHVHATRRARKLLNIDW